MRIDIDGSALSAALADGAYERRATTLPILAHALLEAEGDSLKITTTDMEATCVATIAAKVIEPGRICAECELLKAAARSGTLRMVGDDSATRLQASPQGGSRFHVPALAAADFPVADEHLEWLPIDVPPLRLAMAIKAVAYASDATDVRKFTNGAWLIDNATAASDGHRGAVFPIEYSGPQIEIPKTQLPALITLLGGEGAEASIGMAQGLARVIRVQSGGQSCAVRLIDCAPPPFRQVMGMQAAELCTATFDRAKLLGAAKAFIPFSMPANGKLRSVVLVAANGSVQLTDGGENSENCNWALQSCEGQFKFKHNLTYLLDALGAMRCDRVVLTTGRENDAYKLLIQTGDPKADGPEQHVIMGLR